MMQELSEQELEGMLASTEKALVVFYADWCPFCHHFLSIFKGTKMPRSYNHYGVRVDEDASPLWDRFAIRAVPTLVAFDGGRAVARRDSRLGAGLGKGDLDSILKELA